MGNDYYVTLGVAPNAEDVVIRAAHKALVQHYNLDSWKGDKLEANRKLFELNEALVVLTDPARRKQYDDSLCNKPSPTESTTVKAELSIDQIDKDWQVACQFNPELTEISNELNSLSIELAHVFKIALLESRRFDECYQVAKKIEQEYLLKLFGANQDIQIFGHELIKEGRRDAAIELNDIVRVMGESIDAPAVIDAISKKHKSQRWIDSENKKKLIILESQAALEKSQNQFATREQSLAEMRRLEQKREAEFKEINNFVMICALALAVLFGLVKIFFW